MNIKGNTQIILTDAKTGKVVKRTNDDNMVTNGIYEFIRSHGMSVVDLFDNNDVKSNPLTTLLGGVFLFHDTQTENANNIKPDGGNALVANGAYDVTTSQGRTLGNFNASESGWMSDNIFRYVYDWTSAQGNGVISSVSLTSRLAGMFGMGRNEKPLSNVYLDSYTTYSPTFNERALLYDSTRNDFVLGIKDNYLYSCHFAYQNEGSPAIKHLVIHRQHICNTEMAFDDSRVLKPITNSRVEHVATFSDVGDFTEGDVYPCIHAYGYFWMLMSFQHDYKNDMQNYPDTYPLNGIAFRMLKIKDDFSECLVCNLLGSSSFGLDDRYDQRLEYPMLYQLDRQAGFFPTSENTFSLYAVYGHKRDVDHNVPWFTRVLYNVTFDTQNPSVVGGGVVHSYTENYTPSMNIFANIIYHANGVSCGDNWIANEDGDLWECNIFNTFGSRGVGITDESLFCFATGNGNINIGRVADYLASINNLNSPVTKDNTQNMKLIYTLTFTD